jgi:hypothetical protein
MVERMDWKEVWIVMRDWRRMSVERLCGGESGWRGESAVLFGFATLFELDVVV